MPRITEYISRTAQANESAAAAEILTGGNVTPERAHQLRSAIEVAVESFVIASRWTIRNWFSCGIPVRPTLRTSV